MGNTSSSANNRAQANASSTSPLPSETPQRSSSRRSRQPPATNAQQPHRDAPPVPAQVDKHRSPSRTPADAQSRAGDAQQKPSRLPHRSLRQKKKSLELPDLALALSPATGLAPGQAGVGAGGGGAVPGPYRRPQASSPIAIPTVRGPNGVPIRTNTDRPKTIAAASTDVVTQLLEFEMAQQQQAREDPTQQQTRGQNPHFPGAPLQYSSTRSFTGASRNQPMQSFALREHSYGGFVPEDVRSSIPLALRKAESGTQEDEEKVGAGVAQSEGRTSVEEQKQPVQVHIVWKAGGKIVELIRAGDNKWKGRQPMDFEYVYSSLSRSLHHLLFPPHFLLTLSSPLCPSHYALLTLILSANPQSNGLLGFHSYLVLTIFVSLLTASPLYPTTSRLLSMTTAPLPTTSLSPSLAMRNRRPHKSLMNYALRPRPRPRPPPVLAMVTVFSRMLERVRERTSPENGQTASPGSSSVLQKKKNNGSLTRSHTLSSLLRSTLKRLPFLVT